MTIFIFILVSVLSGLSAPLVKFTTREFSPILLIVLRSSLALLIITPIIISHQKLSVTNIKNKTLILAGLLFSLNWILFASGIQQTSIIMSQLLYIPSSLLVLIMASFLLKEKIRFVQITGIILASIGMLILIRGSAVSQDLLSFGKPLGNLIVTAAVISWSLYLVISRKISTNYSPSFITFFNFAISFIVSLTLFTLNPGHNLPDLATIPPNIFVGLIALSLLSSVVVFYLIQWLVKNTSAFIPSLTLYSSALSASVIGIIFFGERLTLDFILAAIFISVGVFVATVFK